MYRAVRYSRNVVMSPERTADFAWRLGSVDSADGAEITYARDIGKSSSSPCVCLSEFPTSISYLRIKSSALSFLNPTCSSHFRKKTIVLVTSGQRLLRLLQLSPKLRIRLTYDFTHIPFFTAKLAASVVPLTSRRRAISTAEIRPLWVNGYQPISRHVSRLIGGDFAGSGLYPGAFVGSTTCLFNLIYKITSKNSIDHLFLLYSYT